MLAKTVKTRSLQQHVSVTIITSQYVLHCLLLRRWYDYAWIAADEVPQYFEHDPGQARLLQELL